MRFGATAFVLIMAGTGAARAQQGSPLLAEKDVAGLANELSGETAKRNLEGLARLHRQRGSAGFHAAAELVAERARAYGLSDVAILKFPADGKIFYGTQRSRPGWDAEVGDLFEVKDSKEVEELKRKNIPYVITCDHHPGMKDTETCGNREEKILSYESMPIVLAEDSESADVTAELVDVGDGTKEADYAGKSAAGGGAGFGGGEIWGGGDCELCAEPEDGLVGPG